MDTEDSREIHKQQSTAAENRQGFRVLALPAELSNLGKLHHIFLSISSGVNSRIIIFQ